MLCRFSLVFYYVPTYASIVAATATATLLTRCNFKSLAVPSNYLFVVSRAVAGLRFVTSGRKVPPRFFWLPVERLTNLPHVRPLATSRWLSRKKTRALEHPSSPVPHCPALRIASQTADPLLCRFLPEHLGFCSHFPPPASHLPPPSRRQIRPLCAHRVTSFLAELTPVLSNATRYILSPTADCAPPRPTDHSS